MKFNLDGLFRETAAARPAHPAIVRTGSGEAVTYRQLDDTINTIAERLRNAGVRPGHCVGLHVGSGLEYIVLNYAIWRCGGCVVPIAVELTDDEKQEIVRRIALEFVLTPPAGLSFAEPAACGEATEIAANAVALPVENARPHPAGFRAVNAAFLRFTSGTTGDSKGVVLSHGTIRERIEAANEALRIGPHDRIVWLLSMSYHFAVSIVSYLSFGATILLPRNSFAAAVIEAIDDHGGTLMYASPMHYALLADAPGPASLRNLRLALSTTASLDWLTAEKFHDRYGLPIAQALGIIEVGLPCINLDFAAEKPASVGRVLPAYQLRLTDSGLGENLKEIAFRGPGCFDAYYESWRPRAEILHDGWFTTGDVGEVDGDGCLFLRGRSTDVINVMGMKFFPQEVETVLTSHPDVKAACILARQDDRFGEVPVARVVLGPGAAVSE
ncbi:MAG: class I adenylate-forming enzyme family protein, partial [Planctomycetaceae bacterium]